MSQQRGIWEGGGRNACLRSFIPSNANHSSRLAKQGRQALRAQDELASLSSWKHVQTEVLEEYTWDLEDGTKTPT